MGAAHVIALTAAAAAAAADVDAIAPLETIVQPNRIHILWQVCGRPAEMHSDAL